MTHHWPAVRTQKLGHHGYEMGHAASVGLAVILIVLPLLGLGLSWLLETPAIEAEPQLTAYSIAQMIAYSPMVSWMCLILGVPAVHLAIRLGFGGWLVTMVIGALAGAIVLVTTVWFMMDIASLRVLWIGAVFGGLFAGVFWCAMRLTMPALFRGPGAAADTAGR